MAIYELRSDRHHSTSNLTYLDIIEGVHLRTRHSEPTALELRRAACYFIGVLIEHRHSGFESMRILNGGDSMTPEKPPSYIASIIKGKHKDPRITRAIEVISSIAKTYSAHGLTSVTDQQWKALQGGEDCVPTSRKLLTRAFHKTTSSWMTSQYTRTGNPNRSNYFSTMASWLFLSTHAPASLSVELEYKEVGYEAPYWNHLPAYKVICKITRYCYDETDSDSTAFKTWHKIVAPSKSTSAAVQTRTKQAIMADRHANITSVSSFLNDVYRFLHHSQVFSLDVSHKEGQSEPALTGRARHFMDSLVQVC